MDKLNEIKTSPVLTPISQDPLPTRPSDTTISSISFTEKSCCDLFYWIYDEILEPLYDWFIECIYGKPPLFEPVSAYIYQGKTPSVEQLKKENFCYLIDVEKEFPINRTKPNEKEVLNFLQFIVDATNKHEKVFIYSNGIEFYVQLILFFIENKIPANDFIRNLNIEKIKFGPPDELPPSYYDLD